MKKLILAPAVALAFTGLVAAPVAAAETPSTQSAQTKAEQAKAEKKEAAEKAEAKKKADAKKEAAEKAAAKKAADKKAADKKAAAKKAADKKAADKKAADDKAAKEKRDGKKDGKKDESKKTPPPADNTKPTTPPKDDDDKGSDSKDENKGDEVKDINASLKVAASSVDAEQLADEGVKVTVTGLEKGDKLTTSGLSAPATTATGSTATLVVKYDGNPDGLEEGKKAFTLKVAREGASAQVLRSGVQIKPFADGDDDAPEVDPKVSIDTKEISVSEFEKNGLKLTGEGFTPGTKVNVFGNATQSPFFDTQVEADEDGKISATVEAPEDGLEPDTYSVSAVDAETETVSNYVNFELTADDDAVDPIESELSVDPETISAEDLADKDKGIKVTAANLQAGDVVTDSLTGKKKTVDENGDFAFSVYYEGDPENLEPGKQQLTVTVEREGTESADLKGEFTIGDDDDAVDPIDASLKVDPKEITAEGLANEDKGVTVTVSGVKKGDKVTDSLTGKSETADADGDYKLHLWYEGNPKNLEEGKLPFTVTIDREGTESQTLDGAINVVADEPEAPAEATLKVSPKSIEAADFANDEKGVTLSVENCEPGADVHFEVNPKGINVTAYENTVTADDEGRASVNVFGTSSNASAYVGAYTATATCGDDTMKDSFKVTEGANSGGDNGNGSGSGDNGNDGSELPRTGADLGGLATGALLLLVGGAAIAVTGRRNKFARTPFSF